MNLKTAMIELDNPRTIKVEFSNEELKIKRVVCVSQRCNNSWNALIDDDQEYCRPDCIVEDRNLTGNNKRMFLMQFGSPKGKGKKKVGMRKIGVRSE